MLNGPPLQVSVLILEAIIVLSYLLGKEGDQVVITIGNPLAPEGTDTSGHGMAIGNIRERLSLAFGSRASLLTSQDDEQFYAVLSLPYVEHSDH